MSTRVELAPGGPEVSQLAYGTWRLLEDARGAQPARVRATIEACLELGITTFDLADVYGGYLCEEAFGAALATSPALRDRIELVTKCGIQAVCPARPDNRIGHYDLGERYIVEAAERSLRCLRTDRIDLLLLHRPSPLMDPDQTAAALSGLIDAGKVRFAGVSNFSPAQFDLLQSRLSFPLVTNQIEISLVRPDAMFDGSIDHLMTRRLRPMAWSPTAGGALFTSQEERPARIRRALESLASACDATPEALAYAWLLAHPSRMQVVLGTNRIERLRAAVSAQGLTLGLQDWFSLLKASVGRDVP